MTTDHSLRHAPLYALVVAVGFSLACGGGRPVLNQDIQRADAQIELAGSEQLRAAEAIFDFAQAPVGAKAAGKDGAVVQAHLSLAREDLSLGDRLFAAGAARDDASGSYLDMRRQAIRFRQQSLSECEGAFRELLPLWLALDYLELGSNEAGALRSDIGHVVALLQDNRAIEARDAITSTRRDISTYRARFRAAFDQSGLELFRRLSQRLDGLDETFRLLGRATEALSSDDSETLRDLLSQVQAIALPTGTSLDASETSDLDAWFARHIGERMARASDSLRQAMELEKMARTRFAAS